MASSYSLGAINYIFKHYYSPEKVKEMAEKKKKDYFEYEMRIMSYADLYSKPYGTFTIPEDKSKDTWAEEHPEFGEVSL